MADELLIPIAADVDVVTARQRGRDLAAEAGFSSGDQTVIAAAISEIARNILMYAKRGEVMLSLVTNGDRQGVVIIARDQGPGIKDVSRALEDGYSTSGGLGLGLPGARRLMDDFDVSSNVANHLVKTVEASRLLGATVIVTGLSPEIAQTLVTIGVDLSEMATVGDLQGGIEEAERLLGYKVVPQEELAPKA